MKFLFKKLMAVCVILTVLVTGFAPSFAAYPSGQGYENGTMFNNFIEYVVANNGLFSVGTTYGNLTNPNDDFKLLLYGHPSPGTSFSTIKVDGSNYIFTAESVNPDPSNLSITSTQNINGVNVVQELRIVTNSNTGKADTVQIKYTATNQSSSPHSVGTRIMMDTMLGENDAAPFRIPGHGNVTTELELTGDNIPDYWQAFDSLTNPSVIAQGTLLRTENKPDKVQFSNWGRVHGTEWDFTVNPGSSNGDSAVTIYWNPTTLQPGESKTCVTYYGLSEFMQDMSGDIGLTLNRIPTIEATTSGYYPNPISVTGYIINNSSSTLENVKAKLILPSGMRVYDDQLELSIGSISTGATRDFAWDVVLPEFQTETTLNYTVEVSADNRDSKSLSYSFTVPATKVSSEDLKYYEGAKYSIGAYNILTGQSVSIIDPVDAATGNFIHSNIDIFIGGYAPISFSRFYNSVDIWEGPLGRNWHSNYDIKLTKLSDDKVSIKFDDGRIEDYTKDPDGVYQPMSGKYGIVNFIDGQGYILTLKDKIMYSFDLSGFLTLMQDISGNTTTMAYDSGKLKSVQNACGSLQFEYSGNLLSKITDNTGRMVEYGYTAGCLTSFKDVDGNSTTYVYDGKNRLTVIIDAEGNAKVTNAYDDKNRVLKQTLADGTVYSISYDDANKTTALIDRNGAQTIYKWDDKYRIYETVYENGIEKAVFNNKSQRTSFTDKNGNTYLYEYDDNGNVTKETNPLGEATVYIYNANNQISSIKRPDGSIVLYTYDEKGNLISSKDPLNRELRFEYNEKNLPVKMVMPDGSSSTLVYDSKGNIISSTDSVGNTTRYGYDSQNRVINIIKPKGNRISFEYTPSGNVRKVTNPDGTTTETTYDSRGLVTEEKDASGNVTKSKYNSMGYLIEKIDALGNVTKYELDSMSNICKVTLPNGAESKFHYNSANMLDSVIDAANNSKTFDYDSNGNLLRETDFKGNESNYSYDALNRLLEYTDANNHSTRYEYGSNGKIKKIVDALQQATLYAYDDAGQLVKVTDVMGNSTQYSYNSLGYIESITDSKGAVTKYRYNSIGKAVEITNPDKSKSAFEYDANGNLLKATDANGNATIYTYDELDRVIAITNSLGGKKTIKYTPANQICEIVDENGHMNRYKYDPLDRLIEIVDAKGNSIKYEYDAIGNLIKIQKPGGVDQDVPDNMKTGVSDAVYGSIDQGADMIAKYEYDLRGLLEKEIDPAGKITSFDYDENGNLVLKTDSDGFKTQFNYNSTGNIEKILYDDGKQISYEYNPLGQMTKVTDWLGTSSFDLDALGRIKKVNDYRNKSVEYSWSTTGEKLSMKYPDGSLVKYGYDLMGRLIKVTDPDQAVTTYKYDVLGNVSEKLLPNGIKTEYKYDALSRLVSMTNKAKNGKMLDNYTYVYDAVGNKTSVNRQHQGDGILASKLDPTAGVTMYKYDALNQLTEVTKPDESIEKYSYDRLGNRIRYDYIVNNKVLFTENYNYDIEGKLSEISASTIFNILGSNIKDKIKMEYDNRGNLIKTSLGDKVISEYTFNAANKLEKAINWKSDITTYTYDGFGRRVSQSIQREILKNSEVVKFFNVLKDKAKDYECSSLYKYLSSENIFNSLTDDSNDKVFTMDFTSQFNNIIETEEESKSTKFVYGLDVISITEQTTSDKPSKGLLSLLRVKKPVLKNYYLQDELGSPIRMVDDKGKTTDRYSYDEFGRVINPKIAWGLDKTSNPFGFTGYQYDASTGLYFAQARYYLPGTGRFMSEDPIKDGLNWYIYCANNPLRYTDKSGLEAIVISGGHAGYESHFMFIETGINAIKKIQDKYPDEKVTWIIADSGYSDIDKWRFENTASCYGVDVVFVSKADELTDYLNTKSVSVEERSNDKITHVEVFAHGTAGTLLLGYKKNTDVNYSISDIKNLDKNAFDNATTWFGSCNTGTENSDGESFAQVWSNYTGGKSTAVVDGQTTYVNINVIKNMKWWQKFDKAARALQRKLINYSADGSFNYPEASDGIYFNDFYPQ